MIQIELTLEDNSKYKLKTNDLLKIFPYTNFKNGKFEPSNYKSRPLVLKNIIEEKKAKEIFLYNDTHDHFRIINTKHKDFNLTDLIDGIDWVF